MHKMPHASFLRKNLFLFVAIFSCLTSFAQGGDEGEDQKNSRKHTVELMGQLQQIENIGYTRHNAIRIQRHMETTGTTVAQAALTWLQQRGYTQAQAQQIHAYIGAHPRTSIDQAAVALGLPAPQ
jgi:hypothetical protein